MSLPSTLLHHHIRFPEVKKIPETDRILAKRSFTWRGYQKSNPGNE
ncbi:hypothetical protein ASZ90_015279 [hydrocarbon metagenome]|uniref:Uncharacterized protein n=1 Tax=hydrocarbon metagenome TaxID=938273 RepID=A0A0W8F2C7_9ZZZZ